MLFSHRINKTSIGVFVTNYLISIIYTAVTMAGVSIPDPANQVITLILVLSVMGSALIAPFSEEIVENEDIRQIRRKTVTTIVAFCFVIVMLGFLLHLILMVLGVDYSQITFSKKNSVLRVLLFLELIYFIFLKRAVSRYLKQRD